MNAPDRNCPIDDLSAKKKHRELNEKLGRDENWPSYTLKVILTYVQHDLAYIQADALYCKRNRC